MRTKLSALLLLALPSLLCATLPGDPFEAVIKEKGEPLSKMELGGVKVLLYPDVEIRMEEGKVVTVTPRIAEPKPATGNKTAAKKTGAKTPPKPAMPKPKPTKH